MIASWVTYRLAIMPILWIVTDMTSNLDIAKIQTHKLQIYGQTLYHNHWTTFPALNRQFHSYPRETAYEMFDGMENFNSYFTQKQTAPTVQHLTS